MKRLKQNFKKGIALVLSLAMVAGIVPAMLGGANAVQAATTSEPSVTAFATPEQLMNSNNFALHTDYRGVAQKVYFGTNGDSRQTWYIAGSDADDSIVLLCDPELPMARSVEYEDDNDYNKRYSSYWNCIYETDPSEVYPNHYGASDLRRNTLKTLETDTDIFTTSEQSMMLSTKLYTDDNKLEDDGNSEYTYYVEDKLYAAYGNYYDVYITVGTNSADNLNGGIKVSLRSNPYNSGSAFWLRAPHYNDSGYVLLASTGRAYNFHVGNSGTVVPAFRLNLSAVLFASAATATTSDVVAGTIADGTAMTFRLDGRNKNIGLVTYNTTTEDIKITKGSTTGNVALVVQGNDGTKDWYYSKQIMGVGTETVNASEIKSALTLSEDIDLSVCKIWLETTEDNITYAVEATEAEITRIEVAIDTPKGNMPFDTTAECTTAGVANVIVKWTDTDGNEQSGNAQFYPWTYIANFTFTASEEYVFSSTPEVVINNGDIMLEYDGVTLNPDGTLSVKSYDVLSAKDKLTSITAPQSITVANGTSYGDIGLPTTVTIVTEGNTVTIADVAWDTTTPASGSYDPALLTEQTVTLNGAVTCPANVDANGVELKTTISITISAAGIVGAPTYEIIDGEDETWPLDSDGNLTIKGNGDFSKFVGVKVDGELLDTKYYTAKEGSTIITLKVEYLNTLSVGSHTFEIVWNDGSADTSFIIKEDGSANAPNTGDMTNPLWFILLLVSGAGILLTGKSKYS